MPQEGGGDHGVDAAPGEYLVPGPLPVGVEVAVQAAGGQGVHPAMEVKILAPGVELGPVLPGVLQHVGQAAVAPGEDGLQIAGLGVMPVVGDGTVPLQSVPQQVHPPLVLLHRDLGVPLEGSVGLGDKPGGGHGDAHPAGAVGSALPPALVHLPGQISDAQHVLVGLGGQAQHEVELYAAPAAGEGGAAGLQQVLLPQILVDGVAQTLCARLRGKGQTALAHPLQALHEVHREGVRPQRGQGHADVLRRAVVQQIVTQLQQAGVVGGAEAGQGHLLIAGILTSRLAVLSQQLRIAVSHRAVHIACLAEPAATDAATEQLQHDAVVDDLGGGDDGLHREVGLVHVLDHPLAHLLRRAGAILDAHFLQGAIRTVDGLIEGRDVDALDLGGLPQKLLLAPALLLGLAIQGDVLQGDLLPFTQDKQVHEGGQRLRVIAAGTARHDERREFRPLLAAQRQPRQVQHVQDIGVGHLIAQREADDIKVRNRVAALQGVEQQPLPAHFLLHISPGGVATLAPQPLLLVHQAV